MPHAVIPGRVEDANLGISENSGFDALHRPGMTG